MKLLFCLFNYTPYGGLQRDCVRIAKACMAQGDDIEIITQTWQGPKIPGVAVHCLPTRGWTNHQKCKNFAKLVSAFIKTHHYDGIIGFDKMPGLDIYYAAAAFKPKAQGLRAYLPRDKTYEVLQQAVFSPAQKTHILLLTKAQQAIFMQQYGTQAERFHILPPGIDPNRKNTVLRAKKSLQDKINILFIGSSFKNKGLDRALYALGSLPKEMLNHIQLSIVGHDSLRPYQHIINKLNLSNHIQFIGASENIPHLLQQADLLLHPACLELTGTVLLEALVASVPVLTTAACGFAHYIEESGAGLVTPEPFSQQVLNSALQEMLLPEHLFNFQQKAYHFSKTADVYSGAEVAAKLIHQIIKQNP